MWDYKVVTGHYNVDGAQVFLKNPQGEGPLQAILDHYGNDRWELVQSSFDNVHREIVLVFKRPKGGVAPVAAAGAMFVPATPHVAPQTPAAVFVDPELGSVKRRAPAGGTPAPTPGGRRSKAELDKLAREE